MLRCASYSLHTIAVMLAQIISVSVAIMYTPGPAYGETPDAIALLHCIEEARASVRAGKLEMEVTKEQWRPVPQRDLLLAA